MIDCKECEGSGYVDDLVVEMGPDGPIEGIGEQECEVCEGSGVIGNKVKVKLNQKGWQIYMSRNGFAISNIDDKGYSTFSYDYFEEVFFDLPFNEFSHDVIMIKQEEK